MGRIRRDRTGMALVELLVALGAISLLSLVGWRLLLLELEQLHREGARDTATNHLRSLQSELNRVVDNRCASPAIPGDWLKLEGSFSNGNCDLERLWLRTSLSSGELGAFVLEKTGGDWVASETALTGESAPIRMRRFPLSGRIRVHAEAAVFPAGSSPDQLRFEFPDQAVRALRRGFVIVPQ